MREIGGKLGNMEMNMEMGYNQFTWFPATIRCVSLRPCSSCFVLCQVLLSLVFWWHLSNMNILNLQIHVYQYMYKKHFLIYSIYTYTYTFVLTHWIGLYTTICTLYSYNFTYTTVLTSQPTWFCNWTNLGSDRGSGVLSITCTYLVYFINLWTFLLYYKLILNPI